MHFCNQTEGNGISRFEFAEEIFKIAKKEITRIPCSSGEFPTKAKRPMQSKLVNTGTIQLKHWKE